MWQNRHFPADLVTFTEKILNAKLPFLCSVFGVSRCILTLNSYPFFHLISTLMICLHCMIFIWERLKIFFVELMNQLFYNTIYLPVWWVDKWWIHFFFCNLFFKDNCIWSPCFFFITEWSSLDTFGETASGIASVCSTVCWDYFNIDQQKVHFVMRHVLQQQSLNYFHMVYQSIFSFGHLFICLRLVYFSARFLSLLALESFAIFWLVFEFLAGSCAFLDTMNADYCD